MGSDRSLLLSTPIVLATRNGSKRMMRRVVKPQPKPGICELRQCGMQPRQWHDGCHTSWICPYFVGQKLWIRETWAVNKLWDKFKPSEIVPIEPVWYLADGPKPDWCGRTRPGRFMPRWASRDTLEVTAVRAERMQDISDDDALAEGVMSTEFWTQVDPRDLKGKDIDEDWRLYPIAAFKKLWGSINGKTYTWESNPWVWVVSYRRIDAE